MSNNQPTDGAREGAQLLKKAAYAVVDYARWSANTSGDAIEDVIVELLMNPETARSFINAVGHAIEERRANGEQL
jgi:hypothetical protein